MRTFFVIALIVTSLSFALSATQTDWSGGGGVPGPVTRWNNRYDLTYQIDTVGNTLHVHKGVLKHDVSKDFYYARAVYAADVDGDGDMDMLGAAYHGNSIVWWENKNGEATSWVKHTVSNSFSGATAVYATDMDNDGDIDIVGAAYWANDIKWWENAAGDGSVWAEHAVDLNFKGARSVHAADLDGDGDMDILGAAPTADDITWWENKNGGGTTWTKHTIDPYFAGAHSIYAADIDKDGDMDILGAAEEANEITWWENTHGNGSAWAEQTVDSSFYGARSVCAADVDGDGDLDILGAAEVANDITWWENRNGSGSAWVKRTIDGEFKGAYSLYATDMDGDGDVDILGGARGPIGFAWWENTHTTGRIWSEHIVDAYFSAASVYAADLNGDHKIDLMGAESSSADIAWWDNMKYVNSGHLESSILNVGRVGSWNRFIASQSTPKGTTIYYRFRSSKNSADMGFWSNSLSGPNINLSGILADSTKFIQYRARLISNDPNVTPELDSVLFTYNTNVGIGDNNTGEVTSWGFAPAANPSYDGNCSIQVSVPAAGVVNLALYDAAGRMITENSQELTAGTHSVLFDNVAQGVYFCTMHAEGFTATKRIVVLK